MNYKYSGKTDIGPEREINQDSLGVANPGWGSIFIVSDGFGHKKGGVLASHSTVDIFIKEFSKKEPVDLKRFIVDSFKEINKHIYYNKVTKFEKAMLGCTAVVMIVQDNIAHIAHIGDSRAYLIRNKELIQLTKDHSFVQNLIDKGELTPDNASFNSKRHVLSRALGSHKRVIPGYMELEIFNNDKFILCSDGVWGFITSDNLFNLVNNNKVSTAVSSTIDYIKNNHGLDNITIQVIHFNK